jgi:hypothetical protein
LISNHRICCLSEATFESERETFYSDHNIQEKRNFTSLNRLFNKVTLFRFIANLLCNPLVPTEQECGATGRQLWVVASFFISSRTQIAG